MPSVASVTKKDRVVEILRDAILTGVLEPGEHLHQEELAYKLGVSLTPLREALAQLEAQGMVVRFPHRGVKVAEARLAEAQGVYRIREVVEPLATKLAVPNLSRDQIALLKGLDEGFGSAFARKDFERQQRLDCQFHLTIYQAAKSDLLYEIIVGLWCKFPWDTLFVIRGRARLSLQEHKKILKGIENGDEELGAEAMRQHIANAARSLLDFIATTD